VLSTELTGAGAWEGREGITQRDSRPKWRWRHWRVTRRWQS